MVFDVQFCIDAFWALWKAVPLTLYLTVLSFGLGLLGGLLLAIIRYKNIRGLNQLVKFYVSFVRGTPVMLQLYMIYYILPYLIKLVLALFGYDFDISRLSPKLLVIIALSFNMAGFLAETIRGGLNALGRAEIEAGYSIGMTSFMVYRRIVIPQVFVLCIPNFSQNLITILHASSLAYFVTLLEVTGTAKILAHNNWNYFEAFVASGIIYWILTIAIELLTNMIERVLSKNGYHNKVQ